MADRDWKVRHGSPSFKFQISDAVHSRSCSPRRIIVFQHSRRCQRAQHSHMVSRIPTGLKRQYVRSFCYSSFLCHLTVSSRMYTTTRSPCWCSLGRPCHVPFTAAGVSTGVKRFRNHPARYARRTSCKTNSSLTCLILQIHATFPSRLLV